MKNCRNKLSCRNCQGRHHHSICEIQRENPHSPNSLTVPVSHNSDTSVRSSNTSTLNVPLYKNRGTILLQTAQAMAVNPTTDQFRRIRLLFDNGSQQSYVTEGLCTTLNLKPGHNERLQLNTFGDQNHQTKNCAVVQLELHGINSVDCTQVTALSFPAICTTLPSVVSTSDLPHLEGLELADDPNNPGDKIDVLIGSDFYWDFMSGDTIIGNKGPIAIKSKLGWLLSGPIEAMAVNNLVSSHMIVVDDVDDTIDLQTNDHLALALRFFWETESLGINPDYPDQDNMPFLRNIEFVQGHYQVGLPWKKDTAEVQDHFNLSLNRLKLLHTRLLRKPELLKEYDHAIKEQLANGIIKPANQSSAMFEACNSLIHYLPHHAVVRQDRETTKLRVVYDGSAREKNGSPSLNDCLLTGPIIMYQCCLTLYCTLGHTLFPSLGISKRHSL